MKKKLLTKIMALSLAGAMVLGMGATAFAADNAGEKTLDGSTNTIVIPKAIVVTNPDAAQKVFTPNVTYKYAAAGVTTPYTITDKDGVSAQTKPGVAGGVSIADVSFTSALTGAAVGVNGYEIVKPINVVVDPSAFVSTGAGIYRYTITESVTDTDTTNDTADLTTIGMTRVSGYDNARILDVYLKNKADGTGLELGGYVVSESTTTNITSPGTDTNISGKNGGFVPGSDTTEIVTTPTDHALNAPVTDEKSVDWYHTFNATLTKVTTGTGGDKTKEFTFAETIVNNGYQFLASETETTAQDGTAAFASGADVANTMKNGDVLYIRGLNAKATVAYTETNNAPETYKVKVEGANTTTALVAEAQKAPNATTELTSTQVTSYNSSATAKADINEDANNVKTVTFTNTLDLISPTGVVLRFAPYVVMLGAAFFLILVAKRRREDEE